MLSNSNIRAQLPYGLAYLALLMNVLLRRYNPIDYQEAWDMQEALLAESLAAKALWRNNVAPGAQYAAATNSYLLLCRHPHVFTLGKSGKETNLLASAAALETAQATFVKTNRGGDITYHGPGQIVGYPILDLEYLFTDLGKYMRGLEEVIIRTVSVFGIHADRISGCTGVWIDGGTPHARKICAMGVRCSRWVTMHGFALNVNTALGYFSHIIPCGISDKGVTSMQQELGREVNEESVEAALVAAFSEVFGVTVV